MSSPTTTKKIAISASLTHSCRSRSMVWVPSEIERCVCQSSKYDSFHGEFAHTSATTVATTSATPPAASVRKKSRRGRTTTCSGDRGCAIRGS
jgi:hypothetical protein